MIIYFFYGLSFGFLGLAALLQYRGGGELPLRRYLPWLAAFGFIYGSVGWIEMFLAGDTGGSIPETLRILRMVLQPLSGLLLLIFGWGVLNQLTPLPSWAFFIPGVLIVPVAFAITYAITTFITPSPLEIPIDIWSRYLLYLPGSIMAGIGFLRQGWAQKALGYHDVSKLMLGAGLAFLFEAFVVGLIVPAAPHSPASYYNYDRVVYNAFLGEEGGDLTFREIVPWLDYDRVLEMTGVPIQYWRMISAGAVTFFVVRGLGVFDATRKREMQALQQERDRAQAAALDAQTAARQVAESWTDALVSISRRITELEDVDHILLYIVENGRKLLGSDFMAVAIYNSDRSQLEMKCFSREDRTGLVAHAVAIENRQILQALENASAYRSQRFEAAEDFSALCCPDAQEDPRPVGQSPYAIAVVPIQLDGTPIGALWGVRCNRGLYSETALIWFESLADQIVIAIQHGLMTAQLQSLSVIEERGRIAREMHDGIAQILGYLNVQVQTLEALLQQGKQETLSNELAQMREAVQAAHADVRENILSLRTTLASETGLVQAVEEYLQEFSIQTGIDICLSNGVEAGLGISSIAEVQLVCILQEALTNVRKHARASRVEVSFMMVGGHEGERVRMDVIDNGVGFTPHSSRLSFGLQTMRERALSVGGTLVLHSEPGKGTRITCQLPCLERERIKKPSAILTQAG